MPTSLRLASNFELADEDMGLYLEELSLDPWARGLEWKTPPPQDRLEAFNVIVIGGGLGGLNAAIHLKRAGIPFTVIEKNADLGGTWFENRYPGCRVDTQSRSYTNLFGVDYSYPYPYCPASEHERYFHWIADTYGLRDDIVFDTEVRSLAWDEDSSEWHVTIDGPDGERVLRANGVITAVGFLNRPKLPEIEGMLDFQGPSFHSARWPKGLEVKGKRFAVIGTGASGYQVIPELALEAEQVVIFQRTPQWLMPTPGYRSPYPPQVNWLDRNLPFYTNFMRFRAAMSIRFLSDFSEIDPDFDDPDACSASNKMMRDACLAFLEHKLGDPELVRTMTPPHPYLSARPLAVDSEYSVLDVLRKRQRHAGDRRDPPDHRDRDRDHRRRTPRGRRDPLRHRLSRDGLPLPDDDHRTRRRDDREDVGRIRRPRVPRVHGAGLPESVDGLRAEHERRHAPRELPRGGRTLRAGVHGTPDRERQARDRGDRSRVLAVQPICWTSATPARSGATPEPTTTTGRTSAAPR